jgi:hypothetical protein
MRRKWLVVARRALGTPIGGGTTNVWGKLIVATAALSLAFAPSASASVTGAKSEFGNCPTSFSPPTGQPVLCNHDEAFAGQIQIGKSTVPITLTDSVDFGSYDPTGQGAYLAQSAVVRPANGQMFSGPGQTVPGGLLAITGQGTSLNAVTASLELAEPTTPNTVVDPAATSAFFAAENALLGGTVLRVPVKIHLNNSVLGPICYLGSNATPIVLALIGSQGPNFGLQFFNNFQGLITSDLILSDNTFGVPGASGCGPLGLLDRSVNSKLGLPSPGGHNAATLDTNAELVIAGTFP